MHTYTAPGGTVFHVNSDGSGDAIVCTRNGALRWAEGVRAEVPSSDLLAFADWLRRSEDVMRIFGDQLISHFDAGPDAAAHVRAEVLEKERDDFCEAIFASHKMLAYMVELRPRVGAHERGYIDEIIAGYQAARDRLPLELKPRRKVT